MNQLKQSWSLCNYVGCLLGRKEEDMYMIIFVTDRAGQNMHYA